MRYAVALLLAGLVWVQPSWAQQLPGGMTREQFKAIPPDVLKSLPPDVWTKIPPGTLKDLPPDLFKNIPPDLLSKIPPNAATMTPEEAKAYYRGLDPAQKKSLKETAKQVKSQIDAVPGLMEKLKALYHALRGS
jgi:hypothetical protein